LGLWWSATINLLSSEVNLNLMRGKKGKTKKEAKKPAGTAAAEKLIKRKHLIGEKMLEQKVTGAPVVIPVDKERTPTGIPGLDEFVEGGFETKSVVIIAGGPGTGKSLMGLQFLYNGAVKEGENGMYITFEEQKEVAYRHAKKFGWDFEALEHEKRFIFLEYPPHEVERFISEGGVIEDMINEYNVKRIVIDSMTSFLMIYDNDYRRRQAFLKVMETLRKWGCTTVLISEGSITENGEVHTPFDIEHLSDGLLALRTARRGDISEIVLEIVKLRGTAHERSPLLVRFTEKGISILPLHPILARA